MVADPFAHSRYVVHKQFWKLFGGKFRVYTSTGDLALFANMKAFRLREDIRLFSGEDMLHELLSIKARHIIDFSAAYDVFDSATGAKIGALKRKGFKSMLRDEWVIMDEVDNEVGMVQEDRMLLALIRRFLTNLVPQSFRGTIQGTQVFRFSQHFNPFVLKMDLDFSDDAGNLLDRRIGLAAAVLLCAIEGREQS
jgi:hypothetical protein